MYVDRENTVFSAPQLITHLLRQQHGYITPSPPSLRSIPGPYFHPTQPFTLSQTFPLSPSELLHCLKDGPFGLVRSGLEDTGTPQASPSRPKPLPILCDHLDGMTPFNPHQACLMGEQGWLGTLWQIGQADCGIGSAAGTSREERSVPSFSLPYASFSLSLPPSCWKLWAQASLNPFSKKTSGTWPVSGGQWSGFDFYVTRVSISLSFFMKSLLG